ITACFASGHQPHAELQRECGARQGSGRKHAVPRHAAGCDTADHPPPVAAAHRHARINMQLRADALDAHLASTLAPLYVITSDEHLLALEAADKIRKAARRQGVSEREMLTAERYFKWGELLAANQSQSLFGDKKLIEL